MLKWWWENNVLGFVIFSIICILTFVMFGIPFFFFAGNELVFTVLALVVVLTVISTLEPFLPRSVDHPFTNDDE
jgi:hypothetical protein